MAQEAEVAEVTQVAEVAESDWINFCYSMKRRRQTIYQGMNKYLKQVYSNIRIF